METKPESSRSGFGTFTALQSFEQRLATDFRWGLDEASLFLDGKGAVHETLRRVCKRLDEAGIPYAVAGGMALYAQGFRRFTKDVDLIVDRVGLKRIHAELEGLGYVPVFPRSKNLRDTQTRVAIEFLITGQYPGDGKPKPIAFPEPLNASETIDGIRYLNLVSLIELKLASGISNANRLKDLADVQELINVLNLPRDFGNKLDDYVRPKFEELWSGSNVRRRFLRDWILSDTTADRLAAMQAEGVTIEQPAGLEPGEVRLVTTDPVVARKYDMHEESEYWDPSGQ